MASINDEHQAGYRAPVNEFHFEAQPPRVTGGTPVSRADARIYNAVEGFQQHVEFIDSRHDLSPEAKVAAVRAWGSTDAARDLDGAVSEVVQRRDEAAAKVDQERRKLTPELDTAGELRAGRIRDRAIRQLEGSDSTKLVATARHLIENADPAELGVLAEEVRPFLESKGAPTNWLEPVIANAAPDYAAKRAELQQTELALQVTRVKASTAKESFQRGNAPTSLGLLDPTRYDPDK
jgi:hypothetical protein